MPGRPVAVLGAGIAVLAVSVLHRLGFQLRALLGAVGIAALGIPFLGRTLYIGSVTDPFPVRLVQQGDVARTGA